MLFLEYDVSLRIGALFAGYGGLDMAVESVLDAEVAWVSEVDPYPSRILAHRYPHAPNLGDVTAVDWASTAPVDVITGGSPCQDLSHAGKRAGMKAGTRSGLWASMCDAIDIIRPRLVLWENVRGALSAEATAGDVESCEFCVGGDGEPPLRALGRVLGDLSELGYDAAWTSLRAADVGAPHERWRVFVLAWPAADADDSQGDLECRDGGGCWAPAGDLTLLPTPTASDANGPGVHGAGGLDLRTAVRLLPTPRATDGTKGGPNQRGSSGDLMLPSAVALLPAPRALGDVAYADRWAEWAPAIARWEAVLGRPAPDPTEPTGKGGAHRLSPRFVEWMMGLPSGWVTDPAIWEGVKPSTARRLQLKALGNGVVPQQAAAALRHLLAVRERALEGELP